MLKSKGAYPPEFRHQTVELVRAGRTPKELAHEFEPTAQSIRNWVSQLRAGRDGRMAPPPAEPKNLSTQQGSMPSNHPV